MTRKIFSEGFSALVAHYFNGSSSICGQVKPRKSHKAEALNGLPGQCGSQARRELVHGLEIRLACFFSD
jgi:hypothetical protein